MKCVSAYTALLLGSVALLWGIGGLAFAGTNSVCYMKAFKDPSGGWIGPPTQETNCNTPDCPPEEGGTGACKPRNLGPSTLHPGYEAQYCACSENASVNCEMIYYYKPGISDDFFYGCPANLVCADTPSTPLCDDNGTDPGPFTCSCQ